MRKPNAADRSLRTGPTGPGANVYDQTQAGTTPGSFSGGETTDLGSLTQAQYPRYGFISSSGTLDPVEANRTILAPSNLTLTGLTVAVSPSGNAFYNFTVRVAGASTALTCTSDANTPGACTVSGSVAVTAGQTLDIQVGKTGSTSGSRTATWSVTYTTPTAASSTQVTNPHIVTGSATATASPGSTVTLTGSSVFTNANYRCSADATSSTASIQVSGKTNTTFTLTSSIGSPTVDYICIGN